ncbi:MAG: hypothetical protein IKU79_09295 [Bacteroidaceae bacterium]|jgi:hypothetical protein|nr:hypothetical protein [Bacteroidaceae bacterium]
MLVDRRRLRELISEPDTLVPYLNGLTNSQFRVASQMLAGGMLDDMPSKVFWQLFSRLFIADRKAYLGTLLKALATRIENQKAIDADENFLNHVVDDEILSVLSDEMTDVDRKKILLTILPTLRSPEDVNHIFNLLHLREASQWIPYLLQMQNPASAFMLLKALRYVEHDRSLLIRTCHFLMKKGDGHSFNLASIIRLSFALDEVRGIFSLVLQPYQLARIEQNFEVFVQYY